MGIIDLVEKGFVPDALTRFGIRRILGQRLEKERRNFSTEGRLQALLNSMAASPIALNTDDANEQHYEVPTEFYDLTLGQHKKYSCCFFEANVNNLSTAEDRMLSISCERAEVEDSM